MSAVRVSIRELRQRMGMTQEEFARGFPVAPRTVIRWESGEVRPSPLAVARIREMAKKDRESRESRESHDAPEASPSPDSPEPVRRRGAAIPSMVMD